MPGIVDLGVFAFCNFTIVPAAGQNIHYISKNISSFPYLVIQPLSLPPTMVRSTKRKASQKQSQQDFSQELVYVRKKQRRGGYWLEPLPAKNPSQPSSPAKVGSSGAPTPPPMTPVNDDDWIDDVVEPFPPTPGRMQGKV